jgi:hypothetical protein
MNTLASSSIVIAGLDPAIHLRSTRPILACRASWVVDRRVKSGDDSLFSGFVRSV